MTFQEILEGITRHRFNLVDKGNGIEDSEIIRKFNEIEWALQAMAEKLAEQE